MYIKPYVGGGSPSGSSGWGSPPQRLRKARHQVEEEVEGRTYLVEKDL